MPPVFSLAQIIQQLQTQWGGSYEGTTEHWSGTGPISYYIGGAPYASGSGEIAYWTTMTSLMTSRATLAFELWDDLIARDLAPASTAASAQIQFEYATRTYNGSGVLSTQWRHLFVRLVQRHERQQLRHDELQHRRETKSG